MTTHTRDFGRARRRLQIVAAIFALSAIADRANAQVTTVYAPPFPAKIQTSNVVTIGGAYSFTPAAPVLTQNSQSGNLCSPGACYVGTVTAKGNSAWKLQVRLASVPSTFSVFYVQTTTPANVQAVNSGVATSLNANTWVTVATGSSATAGAAIGVMFNARKAPGNSGIQPSGAQLGAVVAYQVVSNP